MKAKMYEFNIPWFEEVYAIKDEVNSRLHVSAVRYSWSMTLDLNRDLSVQLEQATKYGDTGHFIERIREAVSAIINDDEFMSA